MRTTYTVVRLPVSRAVYDEIRAKLVNAGYQHTFDVEDGVERIDMTHIAIELETDATEGYLRDD